MRTRQKLSALLGKVTLTVMMVLLCLLASPTNVAADPVVLPASLTNCPPDFARLAWPDTIRKRRAQLIGKVVDLRRLREKAIVLDVSLGSQARLPELGEKTYIYIIDSQQRLALVERILDPGAEAMKSPNAQFLGSHEGLFRLLQNQSQSGSVGVLAAGEVVIRNGRVYGFSNGSGTFRGGTENLNFALAKLKKAGLKIDDETEIRNYAVRRYKDPHDVAGTASVEARQQLQRPEFNGLMEETRRVMKLVDRKFQNPFEDFYLPGVQSTEDDELKFTYRNASELLTRWRTIDEDDWLTVYAAANRDPATYRRALRILEEQAAKLPESSR